MKNLEFKKWEWLMICLAKHSVGKSIPAFCYEVKKPNNLQQLIEK